MGDKDNKGTEVQVVTTSPSDQKASNNEVPSTLSHMHPDMQPISGHCMKGGKYN